MTKTTIDNVEVDLAPERRTPVPPEATGDEGKAVPVDSALIERIADLIRLEGNPLRLPYLRAMEIARKVGAAKKAL